MPQVALGNEAMVMAATGGPEHDRKSRPPIVHTHGDAAQHTRLKDKKSLDYVLRSGLAGGVAGCAVCRILNLFSTLCC